MCEENFVKMSKRLDFQPAFLKEIIKFRMHGNDNTEIAKLTGISRVTVNNYMKKLRELSFEDTAKLVRLYYDQK